MAPREPELPKTNKNSCTMPHFGRQVWFGKGVYCPADVFSEKPRCLAVARAVRCHSRYTNSDLHTANSSSGSCRFDWETLRLRQRSHDHQSRSELHTFITTYTGIRGQTTAGTPEFSAVTTLDGHQIDYYDSDIRKLIPKQDWMKKFASEEMWKEDTEIRQHVQQIYKNNIVVLMERFNQSHGVHTYQRMYGCDWDDHTEDSHGFDQHGYDGQDFITLDLKEFRYITPVQQAMQTVQKWNNNRAQLESLKHYYDDECVYWLKEFLKFGKADLERRAPQVSLLQKDPSSPVMCHATGFYPSGVSITWFKNGQEHYEDVDLGEILPNEDETFQRTLTLHVTPDEWKNNQYSCGVEHQGKTTNSLEWNVISSSNSPTESYIIIACVGVFIVLVIGAVVCIVFKKLMNSVL